MVEQINPILATIVRGPQVKKLGVRITLLEEEDSGGLPGDCPAQRGKPKGLALKLFLKLNLFCRELSVILCLLKLENHLSSHRLLKPNAPHKFLTPSL
jgi:hypothetical protein